MMAWQLYALRHGYTYLRLINQVAHDKAGGVWGKVHGVQKVLEQPCDLAVLVDQDVVMVDPNIPFTSLLQRWNFTGTGRLGGPAALQGGRQGTQLSCDASGRGWRVPARLLGKRARHAVLQGACAVLDRA